MTKTAKTLLVLSIICVLVGGAFNIGWINPRDLDALYAILPLGAVLFGLFLIVLILEKESTVHEQDRHLAKPSAESPAERLPPQPRSSASRH